MRWFAVNAKGEGFRSDEIRVALVDQPAAPSSLTKISILSSQTAITVEWSAVTPGVSPGGDILGYILFVTDPNTSVTTTVFDGFSLGLPAQTQFTVYGLTTSVDYLFSVRAVNFNHEGPLSE